MTRKKRARTPQSSPRAGRDHVPERIEALPGRLDGRASGLRNVHRLFLDLEMRDVARTVREDVLGRYADERLCAGNIVKFGVVKDHFGAAVDAEPPAFLANADEQKSDMSIDAQVTETAEHAVAVVIGKGELIRRHDLDETRRSAFERTVGTSLVVRRRKEKEGHAFDEVSVVVAELRAMRMLDKPVGQRATPEPVLQFPLPRVIHGITPERDEPVLSRPGGSVILAGGECRHSRSWQQRPTLDGVAYQSVSGTIDTSTSTGQSSWKRANRSSASSSMPIQRSFWMRATKPSAARGQAGASGIERRSRYCMVIVPNLIG